MNRRFFVRACTFVAILALPAVAQAVDIRFAIPAEGAQPEAGDTLSITGGRV